MPKPAAATEPQPNIAPIVPERSPAKLLFDEELIEASDLAQTLGRTDRTLRNLARKHGLRKIVIARKVFFRRQAVREFIARLGQKPARRRRPRGIR